MQPLGLKVDVTAPTAVGEKAPKKKVERRPQYITVEESEFPALMQKPLDGTCHMLVKVRVCGHPEYGPDNGKNQIRLELIEGKLVNPAKPDKGREGRKELGY